MEIKSLYKYFMFGWDWHILSTGAPSKNQSAVLIINEFQNIVKDYNLDVTKQAIGQDLEDVKKKIQDLNEPESKVPENIVKELHDVCSKIDKTLDSEIRLRSAIILEEKRLGLSRLNDKISDLFEKGVFDKLTEHAQKDFIEAGKCIAFERYTAGAFHILRGTEAELRRYYLTKVKRNRVKPLLWDKIVKDLCTKKIPKGLLAVLDSIREDYRNPTAHPEKFYGEDEVQSLFTHCIDIVNRMIKDLK